MSHYCSLGSSGGSLVATPDFKPPVPGLNPAISQPYSGLQSLDGLPFGIVLVLDSKASIFPRSSLLGTGQLGLGGGKGGWVNWVKGYKRGQFADNLGPRWTNPVTSGGSQVSGRGHKGELVKGTRGARGAKGGCAMYICNAICVPE
jgi:hypothetical protein